MLKGRIGDTSGRPYYSADLTIPDLKAGGPVSFLMDTGADCTVLMPADAKRLGVDHAKIMDRAESHGVGGKSLDYAIDAIITIIDPGVMAYAWQIKLRVMAPHPAIEQAPSLLGRDILKHWRLIYEPSAGLLQAKVKFSHAQTELRKK
jgi:hypothetical protein